MSNLMKIKRDLLKDFVATTLQAHDPDYTVVDRLRMATFQQTSRAERIQIMGESYAYAEVLHRPQQTPEGQRSAKSTTRNKHHTYDVFVWYKYEDADSYANSSQKLWDDITYGPGGLIMSLEDKPYLEDGSGNQYTVSNPRNQQSHEVVIDSNPLELAHFMNFQIRIRG